MFPSKHLQRLGVNDTVEVQIFYLDVFYEAQPKFRLLFDGYITGWAYQSTAHGRAISFQATADIAKYHQARMDFLTSTDATAAYLAGAGTQPNTVPAIGVFHSYALLKRGLQYPENEAASGKPPIANIARPFEYLWNTAMALCSSDLPPRIASIPVVNYFSRWVRRRNFVNRLVGFPYFDDVDPAAPDGVFPIIRAVQSQEILAQIGAAISAEVGQAGSMMDVLMRMLGSVYCELMMLPTPPIVRTDRDGMILGGPKSAKNTIETPGPLRLANYFVKPQCLFGMVPTCNVLFPSQVVSIAYQEEYNTQPTRVYAYDQFGSTVIPHLASNPIARETMAVAYPAQAEAAMHARPLMQASDPGSQTVRSAVTTGKNILVWPEEFFIGPIPSHVEAPYVLGLLQVMQEGAAGAAGGETAAGSAEAQDKRERLLRMANLYAQYEYYRQRYAQRGGAANLTFNPYVVPGFPCVIYDHRGSGYDQVGYVVNVSHTLSKGGMSTAINYSHGRTLGEFSADLKDDCQEHTRRLGSAPREVVDSVRQGLQDPARAQAIYQRLFYPDEGVVAAHNPLDFVEYLYGVKPDITGTTETEAPLVTAAGEAATPPTTPPQVDTTNVRPDDELVPRDQFRDLFAHHDKAMNFTARPVCSLLDYIQFIHGENAAQIAQEVVGLREWITSASGGAAIYYDHIFRRIKHDGPAPSPQATGTATQVTPPNITPHVAINTGPAQVTTVSYKATSQDWTAALVMYRDEIENSQTLIE
jgi:hypothetical protein